MNESEEVIVRVSLVKFNFHEVLDITYLNLVTVKGGGVGNRLPQNLRKRVVDLKIVRKTVHNT